MKHRWLVGSDWHPGDPGEDPETGNYDLRELEQKLKADYGGDAWRVWEVSTTVPGAGLAAGYTRDKNGRYVLSAVMLVGEAISADMLRKVPVIALENSINIGTTGKDKKDVRALVDELPPLQRTPDMAPEDFSRLVAEHYKTWAMGVPHPAPAMAAHSGTKLPTVHTWIREARLRGFLPPSKGRRKSSS